jgi:hypothetical protein
VKSFIEFSLLHIGIFVLYLKLFNIENNCNLNHLNFKFIIATEMKELEIWIRMRYIISKIQSYSSLFYRNILKTVLCVQCLVAHS